MALIRLAPLQNLTSFNLPVRNIALVCSPSRERGLAAASDPNGTGGTALADGELDHLDLNMLAIHCRKMSESHDVTPGIAEEARGLTKEWSSLISSPMTEIAATEDLRKRMAQFLARTRTSA